MCSPFPKTPWRPRESVLVTESMALAALLSLALSSAADLAEADGLDGRWCSPDGRRVTVSGLTVITPAGREVTGRYSQKAFAFVMPAREWDGGKTIWMELKAPNSARVSVQSPYHEGPPPHVLWRRCPDISDLRLARPPRAIL